MNHTHFHVWPVIHKPTGSGATKHETTAEEGEGKEGKGRSKMLTGQRTGEKTNSECDPKK
jgi:hypothetical protein